MRHFPTEFRTATEGFGVRSRFLHLFRLSLRRLGRDVTLPLRQFGDALGESIDQLARQVNVFRRSVNHSPEWFFVTTTGFVGIGLTTLMFLTLTADRFQWLGTVGGGRSIQEARAAWARVEAQFGPRLDTRDPLARPGQEPQYLVEVESGEALRSVHSRFHELAAAAPRPSEPAPPTVDDREFQWPELPPRREAVPERESLGFGEIRFERVAAAPQPIPDPPSVSVTVRSVFPDQVRQVRLREVVGSWSRSSGSVDAGGVIPVAYIDRRDLPPRTVGELDRGGVEPSDHVVDASIPSSVEIGLDLTLLGPVRGLAHLMQESYLKIANRGSNSLPRLQIIEPLGLLETVVDARPLAQVADGALQREIVGLNSGSERQLSVRWIPRDAGRYRHEVTVIAEALVAAQTEVGSAQPQGEPLLAIAAKMLSRGVRVDETLEVEIEVRNDGDAEARNVAIYADISPTFEHRYGRELEYRIGNLPAGGVHRTVLRLSGREPGEGLVSLQALAAAAVPAATRVQSTVQPLPVTTTTGRQPLPEPAPRDPAPRRERAPVAARPTEPRPPVRSPAEAAAAARPTAPAERLGDVCRCCPPVILYAPVCVGPVGY